VRPSALAVLRLMTNSNFVGCWTGRSLTEALEQQTATGEILRIISSSPSDIKPVLDAVARSAMRLCESYDAMIMLREGEELHFAVHHGPIRGPVQFTGRAISRGWVAGRTVLDRQPVHVHDLATAGTEFPVGQADAVRAGYRTTLSVPLLREGEAIGVIHLRRREVRPFTDNQIALLQTFADQAVIAIENVRLFTELQEKNAALTQAHAQVTETLEQQTATSEILRVISSSPTDVQPVFDAIVQSASSLCEAEFSAVVRFEDGLLHLAGTSNVSSAEIEAYHSLFPRPPRRDFIMGRAFLDGCTVHVEDVLLDPDYDPHSLGVLQRAATFRTYLGIPIVRNGIPIGAIGCGRYEVRPFTDAQVELVKTFADQAVIAIENVRLFKELEARNRDLMATSEILQVISRSPTDVQPVFDAIVRSSVDLCHGVFSTAFRFDGERIHLAAQHNISPEGLAELRRIYPARPTRAFITGRAILDRAVVHIPDIELDPENQYPTIARVIGGRSILIVPMLREGAPIGAITVARAEPGPFSEVQIALLQTFADQAVIAIENVRLFTELQEKNRALTQAHGQVIEALEQQTATSDILRVISQSQTDVQPVFDTIVNSAGRLLRGPACTLSRIEGDQIALAAMTSIDDAGDASQRARFPMSIHSEEDHAQAVRNRAPLNSTDAHRDPRLSETQHASARLRGYRSLVVVPLVRHDEAVGALGVARAEPGGFTDDEIALLKAFADQAVIAIENVRLFTELQEKNGALAAAHAQVTEALEQQTATSDILRVISRSQTDIQPVFDTIVQSAVRLLDGYTSVLSRTKGDQIEVVAFTSTDETGDAIVRASSARPLASGDPHAWVMRDRVPLNYTDAHTDRRLPEAEHTRARVRGYQSLALVPLLRHDESIGSIAVTRREPGGFTDDEIALLQTFADQAVIAIENARLLSELQSRTAELTQSVEQLTALGEVGRAVSSSLDLDTVLSTIVGRAVQLSGTDGGTIFEYDEGAEEFTARATLNADEGATAAVRASRLRRGEGAVGQMAVTREPFEISDITTEGAYESRIRGAVLASGTRSVLAIPLLHEQQLVGGLVVTRRVPGAFSSEIVELLKTFATQSALAIQNARLFQEIEDKSRELEAASRHKSEFLANMSHELRTPLNAIIGFSEVLNERMFGELNEKQEEYLKDIYSSGQHLLSLINDILDLSKIEAGRMELEVTDFDLPSAIDNALTLVRERASRRGIRLGQGIDDRVGMIRGDERKVKQVLLNLLSNALKFTPEGGRIDIRAAINDGMAEISVADTGVGIATEDQEAIFEEFRQVGTADKKGGGLGSGWPCPGSSLSCMAGGSGCRARSERDRPSPSRYPRVDRAASDSQPRGYGRIEDGATDPTSRTLAKLAEALATSLSDLLTPRPGAAAPWRPQSDGGCCRATPTRPPPPSLAPPGQQRRRPLAGVRARPAADSGPNRIGVRSPGSPRLGAGRDTARRRCWEAFGAFVARDEGRIRRMLWHWLLRPPGGRCLRMADYVTVRRSSDGGARRRRVLKLPTLSRGRLTSPTRPLHSPAMASGTEARARPTA